MIPILEKLSNYGDKTAVIYNNKPYSYLELSKDSNKLNKHLNSEEIKTISFLINGSYNYYKTLLSIWKNNKIAVPLSTKYPIDDLVYFIKDSESKILIHDLQSKDIAVQIKQLISNLQLINIDEISETLDEENEDNKLPKLEDEALIIYTSGTTNKPKGVVHTHASLDFQFKTLSKAWSWTENDFIPIFLPLHHIHGIINKLCCALYNGAKAEIFEKFETEKVYQKIIDQDYTVFMAVPTIYSHLIQHHQGKETDQQTAFSEKCKTMRLMISGSAALPVKTLKTWKKISNHTLLERYGMSEIGMAISNPYIGERRAGHIGQAFEGIQIQLLDDKQNVITEENIPGEIHVKGPNLFKHYFNKLEQTESSFNKEEWFITGDMAVISNGYYKIVGRKSVDIIKSGAYKISALEIEEQIRKHPEVLDCAVVGKEDETWGEIICAMIICKSDKINDLESHLKQQLASHKIPRIIHYAEDLPRNSMGKVLKKELKKYFSTNR